MVDPSELGIMEMLEMRPIDLVFIALLTAVGPLFQMLRRQLKEESEARQAHELKVSENERELTQKIADLTIHVTQNYMPRSEIFALGEKIDRTLIRIERKLDRKVDRR